MFYEHKFSGGCLERLSTVVSLGMVDTAGE